MLPVLFGISLVVFFLIHAIPGNPADILLGEKGTEPRIKVLEHKLGLDRSLPIQYLYFLKNIFSGTLGTSFVDHLPVRDLILGRLPITGMLLAGAILFSLIISVPLAILAASREGGLRDQVVRVIPIIGLGMPQVWVGIMLLLFFGLKFPLFPVSGFGNTVPEHIRSMVLPSLTIAISLSPILIRSLRASMLELLESDFVLLARSKGLRSSRINIAHLLRNAMIASITVLGINVAYIVGSAVVVERVFAIPGTGTLLIDAIGRRDYPVVQGTTLYIAVAVVLTNLITDLLHAALDPRVAIK